MIQFFFRVTLCFVALLLFSGSVHVTSARLDHDLMPVTDSIIYIQNPNGPKLGYSASSGLKILTVNGLSFKDLNKNGMLDVYEDWRLPAEQRVRDLASKMTIEQIAGLMLYSPHQAIPSLTGPFSHGTYMGKTFRESGAAVSDLSDQQKEFLTRQGLRHVLITSVRTPGDAARWNNKAQALVEEIGLGIPVNTSSDPRHSVDVGAEYTAGAGGKISQWPDPLGLAATFDPKIVENFGHIAAQEYRALGITTALSPQIDLGTEPRWVRINGTFGEDPQLAADMARAYVDGFQTSTGDTEIQGGWGFSSVNTMIKHWPGGGPEEAGRDAHYAYGKYAVYPGNNLDEHLLPFVTGGLRLTKKTSMSSALMPYYTVSFDRDLKNKENVGNAYSSYFITDLLRNRYNYDGVVCTDWMVTADEGEKPDVFKGKPWGMEKATLAERHYKVLMAGADQFGGNNEPGPVLQAYTMGVKAHDENFMRARFEVSAVRLLRNIMRLGLFENPYVDPTKTSTIVGNPNFMKAGYDAQLKSIVLLKNDLNVLPLKKGALVYLPQAYAPSRKDFLNNITPAKQYDPVSPNLLKKYFSVTTDPAKAACAIVFVSGPDGGAGYDRLDVEKGGNGYMPISLQYKPYTATLARNHSIAAGDPVEPGITNRSYKGKIVTAANLKDLETILETRAKMKGKPVIVCASLSKPAVLGEFEKEVNAIVVSFGVQNQAILDILTGAAEPQGLLPFQLPANMETVELQNEDVPHDMICYRDSTGCDYDFGFGLNWQGVIHDLRTIRYTNQIKKPVIRLTSGLVRISCKTPGTQIYFTLDGTTPSFIPSHLYKQPVDLNGHGIVKVIAKSFGVNNSNLVVMKY